MKSSLINYVETCASRFRQSSGLSSTEAVNLKSLLLRLEVLTVYRPLANNFYGMSLKGSGKCFILVNSNLPKADQHITIAHELYHLFVENDSVPHQNRAGHSKEESERMADLFASSFLMPTDGVRQLMPEEELRTGTISLASILKLSFYFGVPYKTTVKRLSDLNLISRKVQEEYLKLSPKRISIENGYDLGLYEPGNSGLVIGDFGSKARRLFETDKISEGHYLELLHKIGIDGNED